MNFIKSFLLILIIFILSQQSFAQIKSINTGALVAMMEGSFSTEVQSNSDTEYTDLRMHMKRIWPEMSSAYWLYMEQAFADKPNEPFKQKVYKISNTYEGRFKITEFLITDPLRFAGEWKKENPLSLLTPDSLKILEGCDVVVTLMNDTTYAGDTDGKNCQSSLPGAKYQTSELKIGNDKIINWERGYDENDDQVWGPEKGGYIFSRINEQ